MIDYEGRSDMNTIRMTCQQLSEVYAKLLESKDESAVFLLAGVHNNSHGTHLTIRHILAPKIEDYDSKGSYHIQVSPIFFNKTISLAEANRLTIIQCHSHPFSESHIQYSSTDDYGEAVSAKTVYQCLNGAPMGSLLFGKNKIIGRLWTSPDKRPKTIGQIRLVDRHFRIRDIGTKRKKRAKIDLALYDRQIRALGIKGQQILSQLKIGIVGLGGTGSSVAEQLAREGVQNFLIVDHDKFEKSNKTRLYGSYANDKNIHKTKIVKRNIVKIQPDAIVEEIRTKIVSENDLEPLKDCDLIFSCTDKHIPRSLLNNMSYQYFIPVIDLGVGLDAEGGKIIGGTVRATLLGPTLPCLYCAGIINPEAILAESLPEDERKSRLRQGYITGLDDDVPAVINFTTMAASLGLMLFKDLLFDLITSKANTVVLDIATFRTSRLVASVRQDCVCLARTGKGDKIRGADYD